VYSSRQICLSVSAFKASGAADVLGSIEIGVLVLGVAVR
jgi:hypothetical protein